MLIKEPKEAILTTLKAYAPWHVNVLALFRHMHNLRGKKFDSNHPYDADMMKALTDLIREGLVGEGLPLGSDYWLINKPIVQPLKEFPCKTCQRKVGPAEKSCWWCGNNPLT